MKYGNVMFQTKITRKFTKSFTRSTSILELIHTDISDNNNDLTRGGKR